MLDEIVLALGGFIHREPFKQLFKSLAKTKDGFLDRTLMCSVKPHLLHEEEVELLCSKLEAFAAKPFTFQVFIGLHNISHFT